MSRLFFSAQSVIPAPKLVTEPIIIKSPPVIPSTAYQSVLKKMLPIVIGLMIIGMFFLFVFASFQTFSVQNLLYPVIILLLAVGIFQGTQAGTDTAEINLNRKEYLNYLIHVRKTIIERENQQKHHFQWEFPDSEHLFNLIGSSRQWERSHEDHPYYMHVSLGKGQGKLASPLKLETFSDDEGVNYEPVCAQAITELFTYHTTIEPLPYTLNLRETSVVYLISENYKDICSLLRMLILQLAVFHDPHYLKIGAFSPNINTDEWAWLKWLPHCDILDQFDNAGPRRYLFDNYSSFIEFSRPLLTNRSGFFSYQQSRTDHYILIVDQHDSPVITPEMTLDGVTVIKILHEIPDHQDINFDPQKPIFLIQKNTIQQWKHDNWESLLLNLDTINIPKAITISRALARWDCDQVSAGMKNSISKSQTFTDLMGIPDASHLDIDSLWGPKHRSQELVVPLGLQDDGTPLILDLKEGDEGGVGPHGLIIGMTGAGKSQAIAEIILGLLLTHPADRLIVIYADFKGEAEADTFKSFPQVVAVISNMSDKKYIADRFAETLRGEVERREFLLREAGRTHSQGAAFKDIREYEEAIAVGADLPPIPTLLIVADEFTLMLQEYPEYAELFDMVARKGRSLRIHILFASQTLDIGRIRDIDKNVNYRMCLKVADMSTSRQIIGTDHAYFIDSSKESKGVGYFVKSPGEKPVKFKSAFVRGYYQKLREVDNSVPVTLSASWFTSTSTSTDVYTLLDDQQVVYEQDEKLIPLIKGQLEYLEPHAPLMWLPPLDTPIPLGETLKRFLPGRNAYSWPIGEIDLPRFRKRDLLIYDAHSGQANLIIHGGPQTGRSTALLTFMVSAASFHSPDEVQFYCIAYGGNSLMKVENLDHTVAVALSNDTEKIRRIFNELDAILEERKKIFKRYNITHLSQFHELLLSDISTAEIFLIVDELYLFSKHTTDPYQSRNPYMNNIARIVAEGSSYGIHLIATTISWLYLPVDIQSNIGFRLELKLPNPTDSTVRIKNSLYRPQDSIPSDIPGRGITTTGEHFLFCLPRLDTVESAEKLHIHVGESISILNKKYGHPKPHKLTLLPEHITVPRYDLEAILHERFLIGIEEKNLDVTYHDFRKQPLLVVAGDQKSGKTTFLINLINQVTEFSEHKPVTLFLIDKRLQLSQISLPSEHEYIAHVDQIIPKNKALAAYLNKRRPPSDLTVRELANWSFDHAPQYIIIDDLDFIPDSPNIVGPYTGMRPWESLLEFLSQAHDIGLRVIVTTKAANISQLVLINQLIRTMVDLNAGVILLNSKNSKEQIRNIKLPTGLIPGRGLYTPDPGMDPEYIHIFEPESKLSPNIDLM